MTSTKTKTSLDLDALASAAVPDIRIVDRQIPTLYGETISALGISVGKRLLLIEQCNKKLSADQAFKFFTMLHHKWSFICDFKDDFYNTIEEKENVELIALPPKILLIMNDLTPIVFNYLKYFKESFIEFSLFQYKAPSNGEGLEMEKISKDGVKNAEPLKRTVIHKFNREHAKQWEICLDIRNDLIVNFEDFEGGYPLTKRVAKAAKKMAKDARVL